MKKRLLMTTCVLLMFAVAALAIDRSPREVRKEERIEKRETRREYRKARRAANRNQVDDLVKSRFASDFPDATSPVFYKDGEYDVVTFMSGTKMKKAYYDSDDHLIATIQKISFYTLPENAQQEIQKHYPGYTPVAVIKYDDNEDNDTPLAWYGGFYDGPDAYFVEIKNSNENKVLRVGMDGDVSFFKNMN